MDRDVLAAWLEEGRSLEWIGREVGRNPSTVAYWVRKHGLRSQHRERHLGRGGLSAAVLRDLVAADLTVREIAERVDRSPATVKHWLKRHGLETTRRARRRAKAVADAERFEARCFRHGVVDFVVRRDGTSSCTRCRAESVTRRRRRVKEILVEEAGGACLICGYDRYVGALHFHHLDPARKRFHLGLKGLARALDDVREEAKKCVLLCANCHAEVEGGVALVPPSSLHSIRG